jgi:hypothetical protein
MVFLFYALALLFTLFLGGNLLSPARDGPRPLHKANAKKPVRLGAGTAGPCPYNAGETNYCLGAGARQAEAPHFVEEGGTFNAEASRRTVRSTDNPICGSQYLQNVIAL